MGISIWTQYVLDNFATVREAVDELKKETFRIDAPRLPNGSESTLHLAITDETGNTAILEYLDGKLSIHEGKATALYVLLSIFMPFPKPLMLKSPSRVY